MLIRDTFKKDIYRPIDPVVKPGNVAHLGNELDEFVITNEVKRHLLRFLDEYNDPDAVGNGAWISGFFGSGKSHLLKILAVILEDQQVDGESAMNRVLKNVDDSMLAAALEAARQKHPSESVLFDIDAIAPNQGKSDSGSLLAAFIKAFNRHCGYFDGDQQHIAKLEYDLDREGRFDAFKAGVEDRCGKSWEDVRRAALLHAPKITAAFDEACGNPVGTTENVVRYYQQTYKPDIHSFALRVREYIDTKPSGFRLNFFVDEVGQFIAQNTNLMVNLQSVAVELHTECEGNSWVVVTSQENMEDIVGQMTANSANDFSKIQARFHIKMTLTSSDAKEVIRDRLLAKKPEDALDFEELYEKYRADFSVLFDFADGAKKYKQYQNAQEFTSTYPFVPYQFELFMTAMRGLSDHNAFTGRHNSTGARSMLGVFQGVAQVLCDQGATTSAGTLAAFDAMFEGLRNDLKSEVYAAISQAEDQLDDPTAVRVLKALLLVKYCQDFRATPANLRVLLYGSFSEKTSELDTKVKNALDELERQVYIRRNGNIYEYLTNEEKEIENEIRATNVPESKNRALIAELFEDICGVKRVTYRNGSFEHAFGYNLKVDGEGKELAKNDLAVDVVTEYAAGGLFGQTIPTAPKTLSIALRDCRDFLINVRTFNQTEQFTNLNTGAGEVREAIIQDKRMSNHALRAKLVEDLRSLLTDALFNAGGVDVSDKITGSGKDAVTSGILELIRRSYTGLQQLSTRFTDNDVYTACLSKQLISAMPEYVETVFSRIKLLSSSSNITVSGEGFGSLTSYFSRNEFGWPEIAVRSAIAQLYATNKVELRKSGSIIEGTVLADALKRKVDLEKITVTKLEAVSSEDLANLQAAYRTFTGTNPTDPEPKAIAAELAKATKGFCDSAREASSSVHKYPFASDFSNALAIIDECATNSLDWHWVVSVFPGLASELSATKKDLNDMAAFVKGSPMQKRWSDLKAFVDFEADELTELGIAAPELQEVSEIVNDSACYKSGKIPAAVAPVKKMRASIAAAKIDLKQKALAELLAYKQSYEQSYDVEDLESSAVETFNSIFAQAESQLSEQNKPYAIQSFVEAFKAANVGRLIALVTSQVPASTASETDDEAPEAIAEPESKPKKTVAMDKVKTSYSKPVVASKADVDEYVEALRSALYERVSNNEIVSA
ncbi:MAG: BREX system P-loop protein BrxC [Coriobacteriaceae bacterium]|nr:BREX system P-loop protein BrxC [Coriobacteriaceae bacterium]